MRNEVYSSDVESASNVLNLDIDALSVINTLQKPYLGTEDKGVMNYSNIIQILHSETSLEHLNYILNTIRSTPYYLPFTIGVFEELTSLLYSQKFGTCAIKHDDGSEQSKINEEDISETLHLNLRYFIKDLPNKDKMYCSVMTDSILSSFYVNKFELQFQGAYIVCDRAWSFMESLYRSGDICVLHTFYKGIMMDEFVVGLCNSLNNVLLPNLNQCQCILLKQVFTAETFLCNDKCSDIIQQIANSLINVNDMHLKALANRHYRESAEDINNEDKKQWRHYMTPSGYLSL